MGCIVSKQGSVIEAQPVRTEIQQHLYKDIDRNGKTSVMFDIDLDTCESVGDHKGDHLKPSKSEARIPARLAPIQNPPVLTAEMIEEKLRRAEEKREQLLASRRLACQKAKQTPNLMMQGKKISTENPLDTQPPAHSTSWILNWSGDETLTDEQLDAILQSEAEFRKPMEGEFALHKNVQHRSGTAPLTESSCTTPTTSVVYWSHRALSFFIFVTVLLHTREVHSPVSALNIFFRAICSTNLNAQLSTEEGSMKVTLLQLPIKDAALKEYFTVKTNQ